MAVEQRSGLRVLIGDELQRGLDVVDRVLRLADLERERMREVATRVIGRAHHHPPRPKSRVPTPVRPAEGAAGVRALLRRERPSSSHLTDWRRERNTANLQALAPQKRGPKSQLSPLAAELEQLRRENQRLAEELRKAEIVIDIQKKVAALLDQIAPSPSPEGRR